MDVLDKMDLYLKEISIDMSKLNTTRGKRQTLDDYLEQLNILNKKSKDAGKQMIKFADRVNATLK